MSSQSNKIFRLSSSEGLTFIEVILSVAVLSIAVTVLTTLAIALLKGSDSSQLETRANELAQQRIEAARSIRDRSAYINGSSGTKWWDNIAPGTPKCYISSNSGGWVFAEVACSSPQTIEGVFQELITIRNVEVGDFDSKLVQVSISWQNRGTPSDVVTSTVLARWQ